MSIASERKALKAEIRREPGHEQWKTIPEIISDGYGDREDLACWLIAELRQKGIKAKPHLTKKRALWHVRVRMPSGRIVDPSKTRRVGMNP